MTMESLILDTDVNRRIAQQVIEQHHVQDSADKVIRELEKKFTHPQAPAEKNDGADAE